MPVQFQPLFTLSLRHSYFTDGIARNLSLVPSAETASLIRGRELILRTTPTEVTVAARTVQQETQVRPFHPLGRKERLVFFISLSDARFVNYTEFRTDPGTLHHFTNARRDSAATEARLSRAEAASEKDLMALRPSSFRYTLPQGSTTVEVRDAWGQRVEGNRVVTTLGDGQVAVQLADEPSGSYSLWAEGGTSPLLTFFKDDAAVAFPPVGVIELLCDAQGGGASVYDFLRFAEGDEDGHLPETSPAYVLPFEARSTRWRYMVVEKYTRQPHRYKIANTTSGVEFVSLADELLPDGTTAHPLESSVALPLQERPSLRLNLQAEDPQSGTGPVSRIAQLPFPGIHLLKGSESTGYTSEIFIYV